MLKEGHRLKLESIDVVIGLLETHGRKETATKGEKLEIVPKNKCCATKKFQQNRYGCCYITPPSISINRRTGSYKHSGYLREKRYQNVEEILKAGIDVFSILNIQHIESLKDLVARVTGVVVRELVPDRILEAADEIVVVDVTPGTLE
jgi:two-component system sensor histidine kinase KdpD